jgi:hypothetical protein
LGPPLELTMCKLAVKPWHHRLCNLSNCSGLTIQS